MSQSDAGEADHVVATPGSFGDLYEMHSPSALKLALVLTNDRAAAEDLVQDAFVRLLGRFVDRRHPDAFDRYLRATIVNLARTRWRRGGRQVVTDSTAEVVRDHAPGVAVGNDLWQRVTRLPPRQRAAVFLRYYEDRPLREIADCLSCSTSAAKSLLRNALQTLRRQEEESNE